MIKSEQNTFTFPLDIGIWANWTCKHKVVHCDLTLLFYFVFFLFFFIYFHNVEYQDSINVSVKFITNYI